MEANGYEIGPKANLENAEIVDENLFLANLAEAVLRGASLRLNHRVEAVEIDEDSTALKSAGAEVRARWVINAAGLGGDEIDKLFGFGRFTVTPRRGELLVFDKQARPLVNKIVLPVPSAKGKGVLVSPTIYGNVMLGPTADDIEDKTATGTTEKGFEFLLEKGRNLMPRLLEEEVTASYAGLRAAADYPDYLIELDVEKRYILAGGIRSTGLTSGMAVAEHILEMIKVDGQLALKKKATLPSPIKMPNLGGASIRPYQDPVRIANDPAYGEIVCFCERVTKGEIRDALASPIPPNSLDGLRRRTRAQNGRCQGFFCGAELSEILTIAKKESLTK